MRKLALRLFCCFVLALPAWAQMEDYLEVTTFTPNPGKGHQVRELLKKAADANRRLGGDVWLAMSTYFGDGGNYQLVSPRKNFAASEEGYSAFMKALKEGFGPSMEKLFADWDASVSTMRSEMRRRRWDLSANVPADAESHGKMMAGMRFISVSRVRLKPGSLGLFVEQMKEMKAAVERSAPGRVMLVSQVVSGGKGSTFYTGRPLASLAAMDESFELPKVLGEEGYKRYVAFGRENVLDSETMLLRLEPELSAVPKAMAALAPEFWNPKPAAPKAGGKPAPASK